MKKIYISPSNQKSNLYAWGDTNEMEVCYKIGEYCAKALKRCGFKVKLAKKGQKMYDSIVESNKYNADLHLCIHTNAGGGEGTEVFVYSLEGENIKIAKPIYNELVKITGYGRGIKKAKFTEITDTYAITAYFECEFHDNKYLAEWIIKNREKIGETLAKGICKAYNVPYKVKQQNTTKDFKPYIITVNTNVLNIRKNAGTQNKIVGTIKKGWKYTIVEEKTVNGEKWGKLKSGIGWINLSYTK